MTVVSGSAHMADEPCVYPRASHIQARITQVLPPNRWHCSLAIFCARASEAAFAQPVGPQAFFASMANAAQVLRKLATTLQSAPLHWARARIAAASADASSVE